MRPLSAPLRVAALDCGTNSLRLLVTDLDPDGRTKHDLHRQMRIVRLGEGVDATGVLSGAALARTAEALADYGATVTALGAQRVRLVATSATRDARNTAEFERIVKDHLGVAPEVVSGLEEATLSFTGATRDLDAEQGPFLVVDIGGGSTEVVLGTRAVTAARSVDIGCVRLTERHLQADPPTTEQVSAAIHDIDAALDLVRAGVEVARAHTVIGLAGSVTTVAALAAGMTQYDRTRIHGSTLAAADIARVSTLLLGATKAQRAAMAVMHPGRVDVIGAGALILRTLVERWAIERVLVSEADILDGLAWSMGEGQRG